jgi:putative membrane protein
MLYVKALHIIFVVTWFAGLFYLVRLFVYHAEADALQEPERSVLLRHFKGAQRRLWYGITWPSAILTWAFGLWMAFTYFGTDFPAWLWLKILFVLGLSAYHLWCGRVLARLRADRIDWSGQAFRVWNEVATLFLVAIVFLVVLKDELEWLKGTAAFLLFGILLFAAVRIYKKLREQSGNSPS